MQQLSPILLFTYKRLETLKHTVKALENNILASRSVLFIFSDGYKNEKDKAQVEEVRNYLKTITNFKKVIIKESSINRGLANSIISGVSEVLENHEEVIVLEDDLITSKNFLNFMNNSLCFYKDNTRIFSISGYTFPFKTPKDYDFDNYVVTRGCSWGWATWKDRWANIDWSVTDYDEFLKSSQKKKSLSKSGTDLLPMLKKQINGKIDSWAIRWYYHQSKVNQYTCYPTVSKIINDGFDESATHTTNYNRYTTILDTNNNIKFELDPVGKVNNYYQKRIQDKFSIPTRIIYGTIMSTIKDIKHEFLWNKS